MSDELTIVLTAGLVATATGLLGPFLVLRRVALMADAVSHAVLPGIVVVFLLLGTRAPLPVVLGASLFAVICVLGVDALKASGLVAPDAAIGLVFPVLFSLGVIGISRYASEVHLDLDSTIYGEIAFVPFRTVTLGGVEIARSLVALACVCLVNLTLVVPHLPPSHQRQHRGQLGPADPQRKQTGCLQVHGFLLRLRKGSATRRCTPFITHSRTGLADRGRRFPWR